MPRFASWKAERQRIQDEANNKREEAANERRGEGGRLEPRPVVPQNVGAQETRQRSDAKADASKTNQGAVKRCEKLATVPEAVRLHIQWAKEPESWETLVVAQSVQLPSLPKTRIAKAGASKTNQGTALAVKLVCRH